MLQGSLLQSIDDTVQTGSASGAVNEITSSGYVVYEFTGSGTFIPATSARYEVFGCGNGGDSGTGDGSNGFGGGGGGGEVKLSSVTMFSGSSYTITIENTNNFPNKITSGVYGTVFSVEPGQDGTDKDANGNGNGGDNGDGVNLGGGRGDQGAGGGAGSLESGADGEAGWNGIDDDPRGAGGPGTLNNWTGEDRYYGSGGGGAQSSAAPSGAGEGGSGAGDGRIGASSADLDGTDGTANRGGGGGGGIGAGNRGQGGKGIIIIRLLETT